jgi:hypothetical protein
MKSHIHLVVVWRKVDWSSLWKKEDWWAFWLGMLLFFLCLAAAYGADIMGWAANAKEWLDPAKSIAPASRYLCRPWPSWLADRNLHSPS